MQYLGNERYEVFTGTRFIELTDEEIINILFEISSITQYKDDYHQREYNKRSKILNLFKKYYDSTKTKKEVFIQIAKELNISFKAVEKAFYTKK